LANWPRGSGSGGHAKYPTATSKQAASAVATADSERSGSARGECGRHPIH
jgi:hypothetical protein